MASANSRRNAATAALVSSSDSFSESFARSRRAICALSSAFLRCAARYRCSIATDSPCVASYCATFSSRNLAKLITALTLRRVRVYSGLVRSRSVKSGTPHRRIRSNSRRVNLRFPMASSYSSGNSRTSAASSSGAYIASRDSPHSKTTISSYARYSVSECGLSRSCSVRGMSSSPRHAMISWFPRMGKLYVGAIAREVWRRDPEIRSSARPTERFKSEGRSVSPPWEAGAARTDDRADAEAERRARRCVPRTSPNARERVAPSGARGRATKTTRDAFVVVSSGDEEKRFFSNGSFRPFFQERKKM